MEQFYSVVLECEDLHTKNGKRLIHIFDWLTENVGKENYFVSWAGYGIRYDNGKKYNPHDRIFMFMNKKDYTLFCLTWL